ncbi:B12-binding domain-containing radical SAM protein [Desulfoplanes sp.]
MHILLVYPRCLQERVSSQDDAVVPMGLFSIGAVLMEQGHRVAIINEYGLDPSRFTPRDVLEKKRPDIVGMSVFNANRFGAMDWARAAKEVVPGCTTVFGGVAATFLWEHLLDECPELDCIVMGEGEATFAELVARFGQQKGEDRAGLAVDIPGLAVRRDGCPVTTPARPFIEDLDSLPIPAKYFTYDHLSLSRGCPGNCTFCGSPKFWKRKVRFHSARYFVDEMELLYRKGVRFFYVSDDTFTMKKSLVLEVCQEILKRKLDISWYAISRVDCVDGDILYWMRRAGCIQISFGVESGSETIRSLLNKNITEEQIVRAFDLTQSFGILARAYFIYACPGETDATIEEHLRLIRRIRPLGAIFYIMHLFPGTAMYEDWKKSRQVGDEIWKDRFEDVLYFESDATMDTDTVLAWGKKLRDAFHAGLPGFATSLELRDIEELDPLFADFYSRLAMTFSHGDYAAISAVPEKLETAQTLYQRALEYGPSARAYLGLGMLAQKQRDMQACLNIVKKGLAHFPDDENLHQCMGIALMNLARFGEALEHFVPFEHTGRSKRFIEICRGKV